MKCNKSIKRNFIENLKFLNRINKNTNPGIIKMLSLLKSANLFSVLKKSIFFWEKKVFFHFQKKKKILSRVGQNLSWVGAQLRAIPIKTQYSRQKRNTNPITPNAKEWEYLYLISFLVEISKPLNNFNSITPPGVTVMQ